MYVMEKRSNQMYYLVSIENESRSLIILHLVPNSTQLLPILLATDIISRYRRYHKRGQMTSSNTYSTISQANFVPGGKMGTFSKRKIEKNPFLSPKMVPVLPIKVFSNVYFSLDTTANGVPYCTKYFITWKSTCYKLSLKKWKIQTFDKL